MKEHICEASSSSPAMVVVIGADWFLVQDRYKYKTKIVYCPFCGEKLEPPLPEIEPCVCGEVPSWPHTRAPAYQYQISCRNCGLSSEFGESPRGAINNWNKLIASLHGGGQCKP
jgi:hypothetical protein